jgi:transglutaminase-like putative cysteine protease
VSRANVMVKYEIVHTTKYSYSEPVPVCHNLVHLAPRTVGYQVCREFSLLLSPTPPYQYRHLDFFGNRVDYFSIHVAHSGLTVTARSQVELADVSCPYPGSTTAWDELTASVRTDVTQEGLAVYQFTFPSRHVPNAKEFALYAKPSFPAGRPVLDAALDLTDRIHGDFRFDSQATTISSSPYEVLEGRAGVCQDFAHFQLACLRSLGVPARSVSGYLRTSAPEGQPRLIGADASHAWISVWCGATGWVDLDATNNIMPSLDHITVAWGRDYADVCPIRGVAMGGGRHVMSVSVDVDVSTE